MAAQSRDFVLKKIHSLTGVVPVGAFVLVHFYNMSYSLAGADAWNEHMDGLRALPYMTLFEWVFIYLPILYHGVLGLVMSVTMSPSTVRYSYLNNWRYILQRVSGVGVLLFVGGHVYKTRFEPWMHGEKVDFAHMSEGLSDPLTLTVYLFGLVGTAFHLGNGLWTFGITWGIWPGPRSQRVATGVAIVVAVLVFLFGLNGLLGFLGRGVGGGGA